ncbi:MAG: molybdenum cofactor guanylyltransferase [Armatimonadetes bacterium]|nr:molybdenum cofactor guanylyltransferase [Armatimonadota bacterium]
MSRYSAMILAGGRSTRMGTPKALLRFGDETVLERLVRVLAPEFAEVVIVAAPGQELPATPARRVEDEFPDAGPLGGLHAGLRAVRHDTAFVTGCDSPFLAPSLARLLAERAAGVAGAVPRWGGRVHPLPAAYGRSLLPDLEARLAGARRRGDIRLGALAERPDVRLVPEEAIRAVDPEGLSFVGMNTPEEYAAAQARLREPGRQ